MNLSSSARDTATFGQKILFYVAIHLLFHRYDGLSGVCNASDSPGLNLYMLLAYSHRLTAVHHLLYLNKFIKIPGFGMHPLAFDGSILGLHLQLLQRIRS